MFTFERAESSILSPVVDIVTENKTQTKYIYISNCCDVYEQANLSICCWHYAPFLSVMVKMKGNIRLLNFVHLWGIKHYMAILAPKWVFP